MFAFFAGSLTSGWADTSINNVNKFGYGANIGWVNWQGDTNNGAVIGQFFCTGFVYSANCGWIDLGKGPTNGYQYSNASSNDYGVNHDGAGNLRGFAFGANIGWINFESNGNPRVSLLTGSMDGYAYGANVGWVGLSNAFAFVQTDTLGTGPDRDGDGIPDAWEIQQVGNLTNLTAAGDADEDGAADAAEYLADTDPLDDGDYLRMTSLFRVSPTNHVAWTVEPTRLYRLELATVTNDTEWSDSGLGLLPPGSGTTLTGVVTDAAATTRFFRAQAVVPLAP